MLTISKLIGQVKKVCNEYSIQGDVIQSDNLNNLDIFDYRINDFINISLDKIFREYLSLCTKEIAVFPIKSLLKPNIIQHKNEDIIFEFDNKVKSISFKVDSNAKVLLKRENDTQRSVIEDINIYAKGLTIIKRKIPKLDQDEKLIIVFSGQYPYLIKDFGVYDIEFENENDIPENVKYTNVKMPENVLRINCVKFQNEKGYESDFSDYDLSENNILLPNNYKGVLKIMYYRLPNKVSVSNKDLNVYIDCPSAAEDCLIYYVASMCMKNYDNQLSIVLYNEAELRLSELSKYTNNHNTITQIADVRGW